MQTLTAQVTDTNHRPRGAMPIGVEFHQDAPLTVLHDSLHYHFTGKSGTNIKTGLPVREDDHRRRCPPLDQRSMVCRSGED